MPQAPTPFYQSIKEIQGWLQQKSLPGEAVVRQAIVLRLLQAAGFDIWNPAEVVPEETTKTGSRADFLIRTTGEGFALELKGMGVTLSPKDYEQVATYAANESTRWAILTNGLVWSVMDTAYNPTSPFHKREVLKVEWDSENPRQVADDLFSLLFKEIWCSGEFAQSIAEIKKNQQRRKNNVKVIKEKWPEVEKFQQENTIADFEKAAYLYAKIGAITEEERDILLLKYRNDLASLVQKPTPQGEVATLAKEVTLHFKSKKVKATVVYNRELGTWTLLKGSEMVKDVKFHAKGVKFSREQLLKAKKIREGATHFVALQDIVYTNPSAAAGDVGGASYNGWDNWIDHEGRSAQFYRPKEE